MKPQKRSSPKKAAPKKKSQPAKKAAKKRITRKKKEDCFITTACVKYFGLPDNCNQLETLRNFRDNELLCTKEGKEFVVQYYKVAPEIVNRIEQSGDQAVIYQEVFKRVEITCRAIGSKNYTEAIEIYKDVVGSLMKRFDIN